MVKRNSVAIIFLAIVALFLVFTALLTPRFGLTDSEGNYIERPMDDYIIGGINETTGEPFGAQNDTGANNAVTSVVFDYRGFDTLGEATVLFTAVAGVIMIFRRRKK